MTPEQLIEQLNHADEKRRYYESLYTKLHQELFDQLTEGDRVGDLVLKGKGEMGLLFEREGETIVYYKE